MSWVRHISIGIAVWLGAMTLCGPWVSVCRDLRRFLVASGYPPDTAYAIGLAVLIAPWFVGGGTLMSWLHQKNKQNG